MTIQLPGKRQVIAEGIQTVEALLESLGVKAKGIAVEVNTGGLYKGAGKTNPEPLIIRRYFELGGQKLSFGSAAHRPENVGFGFDSLSLPVLT